MRDELRCLPYRQPDPVDVDSDGGQLSILALASRASASADRWRHAMDSRADFRSTLAAAGAMARAIDALSTAIGDAVACGNGQLS